MSGVRRSSHGGGSAPDPCTSVGRNRHSFVQGEAATDPPEWKTAEPPDRGRRRTGRGGGGVARGMLSLQVGLLGCSDSICFGGMHVLQHRNSSPQTWIPTCSAVACRKLWGFPPGEGIFLFPETKAPRGELTYPGG